MISGIKYDKMLNMENNIETKKNFSIFKRAKSFAHAGRGIKIFLKTTHNAWIELALFVLAIFLAFYFNITIYELLMLILVSGLVFVAEAFNTAIEIDMNLTSPEFHPFARDTKDVAAGAVLISAIVAVIVGVIIFAPHIFSL
jgi:diacylglycerol kinase (ATP)